MSIPFSAAAKSSIIRTNRKPCYRRYDVITSELIMVPKHKTTTFPQLSKQGVSVADLHVQQVVEKQSQTNNFDTPYSSHFKPQFEPSFLKDAYEMCRNICAEYAKTFYLGKKSRLPASKCVFGITVSLRKSRWSYDFVEADPKCSFWQNHCGTATEFFHTHRQFKHAPIIYPLF